MEKRVLQQGDVILAEVLEIPSSAKKVNISTNNFIVERGEGMNTHDLIADNLSEAVEIYEDNGILYFRVLKAITLNHQEHGVQVIEPNKIYRKISEREWDYESEEARKTQD